VASRLPPPPELRCRSANEDFHPTPAEVSRTRGLRARERACRRSPPGEACPRTGHRALRWHTHAQGSLSQARSARAPPVTVPLRSRLESPKSSIVHRTEVRRRSKRFRLADVSSRGSRTIHENPNLRAHVRRAYAHRPSRPPLVVCRCQQFMGAQANQAATVAISLSRVTPAGPGVWGSPPSRPVPLARLEGRAAHASRPPKGLGIASPGHSAKSDRDRQYPRCFPSLATCLAIRTYVQGRCAGRVLSTAYHQPVERARCLFRPSSGTAALTGPRQRKRGLPCGQDEPKLSRTGRWLPTRLLPTLDP
jgi:hypothetical protein